MAISLYDLSVPTFLQTVNAIGAILDRAIRYFAENNRDIEEVVTAQLVPDMAPFHFQVESVRNHSVWGMQAVKTGVFASPPLAGAVPFADLRAMIGGAAAALEALTPDEVNSWSGKQLDIDVFRPVDEENACTSSWAPRRLSFTPETYILTYALPNFYFHAVTAYDILRAQGVPIGKGDYEGRLRTRHLAAG